MQKLTDKQKAFCEEYLKDLNGTQAAIRAGYSKKTAHVIAAENLTKPNIQKNLQIHQKERQTQTGITQERVLQELGRLAFADHRKFFDDNGNLKLITEFDNDAAASLAGFEASEDTVTKGRGKNKSNQSVIGYIKKIKTYDKTKALELLGRHLGIFERDNEQLRKAITVNIT